MESSECWDKYVAFYSVAIWKLLRVLYAFFFLEGGGLFLKEEVVSYHVTYNMYISRVSVFDF